MGEEVVPPPSAAGEPPGTMLPDGSGATMSALIDMELANGKREKEGEGAKLRTAELKLLRPPSHLPQPEAPPGLTKARSTGPENGRVVESSLSTNAAAVDVSAIGKYLRERGNSFSSAIAKRISSLKEASYESGSGVVDGVDRPVTQFHLSGLKVVVRLNSDDDWGDQEAEDGGSASHGRFKGRISFFSRSGCRDCGAVRSFFREKGLPYVEVNVDVFPEREKELVARTGSAAVPAIFFNEKLLGGLVALNSLRNSGEFDRRLNEMAGCQCPEGAGAEVAPATPLYGFDDEEAEAAEREDEMVAVVRVLRHRLPIQDRISRMKLVKNCFAGGEMVEAIVNHFDCGRQKAVEIGKEIARKHFIHQVFREKDFVDESNQFYRFLEHDPSIPKCFNFRESTNDSEPKPAVAVGQRLTKLMVAILEAYASDDRCHLDYSRIRGSEEFRRYVNAIQDLQRVDLFSLSSEERLAFFLNLHNAMAIHAVLRVGCPGVINGRAFHADFHYIVGGYPYSPSTIKNGILRANRRQPYSLIKPFNNADKRLELAMDKVNPLIHFGLCTGTRSSPPVGFFSAQGVDLELRCAAREFFLGGAVEVDLGRRTVHLTRIFKWYSAEFGQDKDILRWILSYLDATKAGLLTHLLSDGGPISIAYQDYDWSLNS